MKDVYIKDKFNRDIAAIEFKSPIHDRVILTKHNLFNHIASSHPEISLSIIQSVVEIPEKVYEVFKKERLFYYERSIQNRIFIVVVGEKVIGKYKKIMTAFELTDYNKNRFNRIYCIYDSTDVEIAEDEIIKLLEQDNEYFYKLFDK
jgi:hypothetical protein